MQQVLKTFATLLMGAVMSAGGYMAAVVVPQLQAVDRGELPSTAPFFEGGSDGAAAATTSTPLGEDAQNWFGSFTQSGTAATAAASPAEVAAPADASGISLGVASPMTESSFQQAASLDRTAAIEQPMSAFAAAADEFVGETANQVQQTATEFGNDLATSPPQFGALLGTTEPQSPTAEFATSQSATSLPDSVQTADGVNSPASSSHTTTWADVLAQLGNRGGSDYRLVSLPDGRLRCDVWIGAAAEAGGVRRLFSAEGSTPVEAAMAVLPLLPSQR